VVVAAVGGGLLLARRLDVLALGDDTAGALGVPVRSTRIFGTILAVLLTAAAVTLAGPIAFVGLCAPVIARLIGRIVPMVNKHVVLIPVTGLIGALIVILADAVVRAILGPDEAAGIPTGVTTTLIGAVVMIALARRARDSGPTRTPPGAGVSVRSTRRFWIVLSVCGALAAGALVLGLLAGSTWLRTGDIALWLSGEGPPLVRFALDERTPRVAAAMVAGGALALAGTVVQGTSRNPLAEPGILGITGGAGVAAVIVSTAGSTSTSSMLVAATCGALVAFLVVYGLSWRGGLDADRLVLVGIGVWYGTAALTTFLLVRVNPWDTPRIYTWLSGTTYGRNWDQVVPVAIALLLAVPLVFVFRRELDLVALDEDTPRLVGVRLERSRLLLLLVAALLAGMSVAAVGVLGFVGLAAPHAARALVGARHARTVPGTSRVVVLPALPASARTSPAAARPPTKATPPDAQSGTDSPNAATMTTAR
jgi:ferric hydroxamate transport system permease protein